MNRIGAAVVMISQGTPFMQAGEEMLRSKNCDENSYKSSDDINNIDWEKLLPGSDSYNMMMYYKGLIELRRNNRVLTSQGKALVTFGNLEKGGMTALLECDGKSVLAIINPTNDSDTYTLEDKWNVIANDDKAGKNPIGKAIGDIEILPRSVMILSK